MSTITTTGVLAASGASLSGSITNPGVIAGTTEMLLFFAPPNAAIPGLYLACNQSFVGTFGVYRHVSGWEASGNDVPQLAYKGTEQEIMPKLSLASASPTASANLTAFDTATVTLMDYTSGQLTFAVVQ